MAAFTRRTFMKFMGGSAAVSGLGTSSWDASAQGGKTTVQTNDLDTDVAVIGAGPGGLSAALRAAELGLRVCIFEKTEKTGGVRNGGMGPFGAGTHIQPGTQRNI
jgi:NADPH-dependent glutamate synthase beta subunit-like oxidoreductase